MKQITIVSASEMKNLELAKSFEEQLIKLGARVFVLNLVSLDLPLYTSDSDAKHDAKKLLGEWFDNLHSTDGFIFVAPEYNGGTPPIFSNFLAWVSRSSKDWRACFNGKPAVIGTHSGGGGNHVLMAMRSQLSFIGMDVLGRQILTHGSKPLDPQSLNVLCDQLLKYTNG